MTLVRRMAYPKPVIRRLDDVGQIIRESATGILLACKLDRRQLNSTVLLVVIRSGNSIDAFVAGLSLIIM